MKYRGYEGRYEFDDSIGAYVGWVDNIQDTVMFEADNEGDLEQEFRISVDEYIRFCKKGGHVPEKPYSGKLTVSLEPALHRDVAAAAKRRGKTLTAFVDEALRRAVSGKMDPQKSARAVQAMR